MRFRFFTVEALTPTAGETELNAFCAQHRIASVDKQFVDQGAHSYWLFWGCTSRGERCGARGAPCARAGAQPQAAEADRALGRGALFCSFRLCQGVVLASRRKLACFRAALQRAAELALATLDGCQSLGFRQRLLAADRFDLY